MRYEVSCFDCSRYREGDALGEFLAYLCSLPLALLCYLFVVSRPQLVINHPAVSTLTCASGGEPSTVQAAYHTRDVGHIFAALAAACSAGLSKVLKATIRQQRPSATCSLLGVCKTYGMPSNHASMMAFAAMQWILWHARARQKTTAGSFWLGLDVVLFSCLVALVAFARVYLGYHSLSQVVAGAALGSCTALISYILEQHVVLPRAVSIAQSWLGRALALRTPRAVSDNVKGSKRM